MFATHVSQASPITDVGITASGGIDSWATKVQTAGNANLRQTDRVGNAMVNTKFDRVQLRIRRCSGVKTIKAKSELVDKGWAKHVCVVGAETCRCCRELLPKPGIVFPLRVGSVFEVR